MSAPDPHSVPLVRLRRAGRAESVHRGRFVLLEGDEIRASGGDAQHPIFVRSAAKPIQALVGVVSGAVDRFALNRRSLAVATGSHSATSDHLQAVRHTLERADIEEDALRCGGHWSIDAEVARTQVLPDGQDRPPALWSNCSGKHAMMLAAARALNAPLHDYLAPDHPTQRLILDGLSVLSGVAQDDVIVAVDGCGAPAPYLPLDTMARTLRRFARPQDLPDPWADAAKRVADAMRAHPDLVAGPKRFDTDLCVAAGGKVLAKCGAEGVIGIVVPDRDLTLVVKVEDGEDRGYRMFVLAVLERLGVLDPSAAEVLSARHGPPVLRNHAGTEVGTAEALIPSL